MGGHGRQHGYGETTICRYTSLARKKEWKHPGGKGRKKNIYTAIFTTKYYKFLNGINHGFMHSGLAVHYCYFNVVRNLLNGRYGSGIAKSKVTDLIKCPEFITAYFFSFVFITRTNTSTRFTDFNSNRRCTEWGRGSTEFCVRQRVRVRGKTHNEFHTRE